MADSRDDKKTTGEQLYDDYIQIITKPATRENKMVACLKFFENHFGVSREWQDQLINYTEQIKLYNANKQKIDAIHAEANEKSNILGNIRGENRRKFAEGILSNMEQKKAKIKLIPQAEHQENVRKLHELSDEVKSFVTGSLAPRFAGFYRKFEAKVLELMANEPMEYDTILGEMFPLLGLFVANADKTKEKWKKLEFTPNCMSVEYVGYMFQYRQLALMTVGYVESGVDFIQFTNHWMHKLKLLLAREIVGAQLFICHGDKHNMLNTAELGYFFKNGCPKPTFDEMKHLGEHQRSRYVCRNNLNTNLPKINTIDTEPEFSYASFASNNTTIERKTVYTYDTNILALPFFHDEETLRKFIKQHTTGGNGVFENVYIVKCLFAGFYGTLDMTVYKSSENSSVAGAEHFVISHKYYKIIRDYAELTMSALDKTSSASPDVGNIISIDNSQDFGTFSKYLISNPKYRFMIRNVRVDDTSLASVHKVTSTFRELLPDYVLGDSKQLVPFVLVPNWQERYNKFKLRVVNGLKRVGNGLSGESSGSAGSDNSWTSVEKPAVNIINNHRSRTQKGSLSERVKSFFTRKASRTTK